MTVPGSNGTRIHVYNITHGFQQPTVKLDHSLGFCSLEAALKHKNSSSIQSFVPYVHSTESASLKSAGVGLELTAKAGSANSFEAAVKDIVSASIPLRVVLSHCFDIKSEGDPDNNLMQAALENDVAYLADLGVLHIILCDSLEKASQESLRESLEQAFYLDVVGEAMRERVGVRLKGTKRFELLKEALTIGVTKVDCIAEDLSQVLALARPT